MHIVYLPCPASRGYLPALPPYTRRPPPQNKLGSRWVHSVQPWKIRVYRCRCRCRCCCSYIRDLILPFSGLTTLRNGTTSRLPNTRSQRETYGRTRCLAVFSDNCRVGRVPKTLLPMTILSHSSSF